MTPMCKEPIKPGPCVTATASISSIETFAFSIASLKTRLKFSKCRRDATSGKTPPYFLWISICVETELLNTSLLRINATDVSSQLDSIAHINIYSSTLNLITQAFLRMP